MRRVVFNSMRQKACAGLLLSLVAGSSCLAADGLPSKQDVQVIGRVLKFQENRKGDTLRIAIVYDPARPASLREANTLAQLIGAGQAVGSLTIIGVLVDQNKLVDMLGSFDAVFAAAGADANRLSAATRQRAIPCLTREVDQVTQGLCTVAVQTSPSIAIYFSSANAAAEGVRFATAFIMMVHEL